MKVVIPSLLPLSYQVAGVNLPRVTKLSENMFSIFESKEDRIIKGHLRHLVRLAKADGHLHKDEAEFIHNVGEKNGLSREAVHAIIEDPMSVEIAVPESDEDRFDQMFDLVRLMMKDGIVNDDEVEFCAELAGRLGFRKVIVGVLVAKIARGIAEGLTKKEIKEESKQFLDF